MRQTRNPYLPGWEFIPDGEPKLFGDRVYVYGSHDEAQGKQYCTGDYVCWSAPADDLANWTFEGVTFKKTDDPNYKEEVFLLAPDVICGPDGRYYLYYFTSKMDKLGVAVCATPGGHYEYYGDVKFEDGTVLTERAGYGLMFDPGIYSGPEGNYLYYGFALQKRKEGFPEMGYKGGYVVQLEDDMLTIRGIPKPTIPGKLYTEGTGYEGHGFLEASSIRRLNEKFYLIYSSELGHELCYAVSDDPMGPFSYKGTIVSNGDVGLNGRDEADAVNYLGNNHGGLVAVDDVVYIFYHRHTYGAQYSRQGCAEKVVLQKDGTIPQVEITSSGMSGKPWDAKGEYSAHLACYLRSKEGILHYSSSVKWCEPHPYIALEGRDQVASTQNSYVHNLQDGAACGFKYLDFAGDEKTVAVICRGNFKGQILVYLEEERRTLVAKIDVAPSETWTVAEAKLAETKGVCGLYFVFVGEGACDMDSFRIR